FSEFSELAAPNQAAHVQYGRGAARFAGATYDPTSHYRAAAVFRFHQELGLTPTRLREISQHQTTLLESALSALDIDSQGADIVEMPHDRRAGFLTVRTPHAMQLVPDLRARGVFVDARGAILRLGPAPYVTDQQLEAAAVLVNEVIRESKVLNPRGRIEGRSVHAYPALAELRSGLTIEGDMSMARLLAGHGG